VDYAIKDIQLEEYQNINKFDNDINISTTHTKEIKLKDFLTFSSNRGEYSPTTEELSSLNKALIKQKEQIKSIYSTKIKIQLDYRDKIIKTYELNGLSIIPEIASITKNLF